MSLSDTRISDFDIREKAIEALRSNPGQSRYWLCHSIASQYDLMYQTVYNALATLRFVSKVESQGGRLYVRE